METADNVARKYEDCWDGTKQPAIYVWNTNKIFGAGSPNPHLHIKHTLCHQKKKKKKLWYWILVYFFLFFLTCVFWFTYLTADQHASAITRIIMEARKRSKMAFPEVADCAPARSPITLIISGLFQAHLIYIYIYARLVWKPINSMLSWHIRRHPLIFHRRDSVYEHASKSLSSLLLMRIYLSHRKWWEGLTPVFTESRAPTGMTGGALFARAQTSPSGDGRIYAHPPRENALSLGGSFGLSLPYWSRSSQVRNFRVPGAPLDRREI